MQLIRRKDVNNSINYRQLHYNAFNWYGASVQLTRCQPILFIKHSCAFINVAAQTTGPLFVVACVAMRTIQYIEFIGNNVR